MAILLNCGHYAVPVPESWPGSGMAEDSCGYSWCYSCAEANERNDIRYASRYGVYMREVSREVTTWTGAVLGKITSVSHGRYQFRGGTRYRMRFVHFTDVHGGKWYGSGSDSCDLVHARRSK